MCISRSVSLIRAALVVCTVRFLSEKKSYWKYLCARSKTYIHVQFPMACNILYDGRKTKINVYNDSRSGVQIIYVCARAQSLSKIKFYKYIYDTVD
jgi:hypothetical protein